VPGHPGRWTAVGRPVPRRPEATRDGHADLRPGPSQHDGGRPHGHLVTVFGRAMRSFLLVPEALIAGTAALLLVIGRLGGIPRSWRPVVPAVVVGGVPPALVLEMWVGAPLANLFGGGFVQDRFALFAKAAALLAVGAAIAVTDWSAEDSLSVGLAMP